MAWLSKRQEVLSQNVASADVPNYTPHDLKPMDFAQTLHSATATRSTSSGLAVTNPRHIQLNKSSNAYAQVETRDIATTPNGNSVSLETEMIKVADTQAQYQAATNIYAKTISMMKTAIGKGGG